MLVGNAHQDQAAKARLDILLSDTGAGIHELVAKHAVHGLHRRPDRHLVKTNTKPSRQIRRVIQTFLAGIG